MTKHTIDARRRLLLLGPLGLLALACSSTKTEEPAPLDQGSGGSGVMSSGGGGGTPNVPPLAGLEVEHGGLSLEQWMKAFFTTRFGGETVGRLQDRVFLPKPTKTGATVTVNDHDAEAATASVMLGSTDGLAVPLYVNFGDVEDDPKNFDSAAFANAFVRVTLDDELLFASTRDDIILSARARVSLKPALATPAPSRPEAGGGRCGGGRYGCG